MGLGEYVPDRLRSTYSFKLLGISVLIVAIALAIGSGMAFQLSDRVAENQLQSVEANAELEANALARWIEGERESIRILSTHQGIDPGDLPETRETLTSEVSRRSAELAALHVVERASSPTSNGTTERIVASSNRTLEGEQLGATNIFWGEDTNDNERTFTFEGQDDLLTSWVYIDDGEALVAMATPVHTGDHVLVAEYRPEVRVQRSVDVLEGTNTVVLGGVSGWVIFEEGGIEEFHPYKGRVNSTEVGARIEARENITRTLEGSEIDETEVRGYHSVPVEGIDWVVVKETPRSAALGLTDRVQGDLATLIGIMVLGFLLIGAVIERGPIRTIKRRATEAAAIAKGDLDFRIEETDRIDEVGQLTESFRNTKAYIETIARQSEALSRQDFDAEVLDEDVPGSVGESIRAMHRDLERFITELEAERERYSRLVEQSNDGVVVIKEDRFVFTNDRFVEITGYDHDTLAEMSVQRMVAPADRERALDYYERRMRGETPPQQYEIGIETKSGEQRTVELSVSRITHEGGPAALVNVRDVTERERRERRLEIFNRVLRHNLRNNLQPVTAALSTVDSEDKTNPRLLEMATEQLDELYDTADTARHIEEAFEELTIERFQLGELLSTLESRARDTYPECHLEVTDETVTVEAAHVLKEALWELLENAFQHAGDRPHVTVDVEVREDTAVIHVSDDGVGVPDTERTALQSGDETELEHTSGLGLWFAQWTVEASGGDLSISVSDGTTVSVTLPRAGDDDRD